MNRAWILTAFIVVLTVPAFVAVLGFNCSVSEIIIYILTLVVLPFILGLYHTEIFIYIKYITTAIYIKFLNLINNLGRW